MAVGAVGCAIAGGLFAATVRDSRSSAMVFLAVVVLTSGALAMFAGGVLINVATRTQGRENAASQEHGDAKLLRLTGYVFVAIGGLAVLWFGVAIVRRIADGSRGESSVLIFVQVCLGALLVLAGAGSIRVAKRRHPQ